MTLRDFLDGLPRGEATSFAARLGISTVYLSQLAARQGGREPSPELSVRIERESEGTVCRWDSRPNDWHRIWPELIGAPGAPEVEDRPASDEPDPEPQSPNPPKSGNGRRGRTESVTANASEPSLATPTATA